MAKAEDAYCKYKYNKNLKVGFCIDIAVNFINFSAFQNSYFEYVLALALYLRLKY